MWGHDEREIGRLNDKNPLKSVVFQTRICSTRNEKYPRTCLEKHWFPVKSVKIERWMVMAT